MNDDGYVLVWLWTRNFVNFKECLAAKMMTVTMDKRYNGIKKKKKKAFSKKASRLTTKASLNTKIRIEQSYEIA